MGSYLIDMKPYISFKNDFVNVCKEYFKSVDNKTISMVVKASDVQQEPEEIILDVLFLSSENTLGLHGRLKNLFIVHLKTNLNEIVGISEIPGDMF